MLKFTEQRWLFRLLLWLFAFSVNSTALASDPTTLFREWSRIDVSGPVGPEESDVRSEAFLESRNQEIRLDSAGGFRLTPAISCWGGFTWIAPNDGAPDVYRPWQHILWELAGKTSPLQFQTRTRLEELKQAGQPEWLWRVRERWRAAFPGQLAKKFTPVIYDEIFLNVNQPAWVSPGVLDQNRAFIGLDSPVWKHTLVEIGYLNQYRFTTPASQIAHVALVTFMISLP